MNKHINAKDFNGKTIERIDIAAVNEVVFYFTDGTSAALEVEAVIPSIGLYGIAQVKPDKVKHDHPPKKRLPVLHE